MVLSGWGRGLAAQDAAVHIIQYCHNTPNALPGIDIAPSDLHATAQRLESIRINNQGKKAADPQAITALLAQQHAHTLTPEATVEALLTADDWVLALGERTVLQEQLVQIFADFAQLRFQAAQVSDNNTTDTAEQPR